MVNFALDIYSESRPHMYYIVQMDCENNFNNFRPNGMSGIYSPRIHIHFTMTNENGEHFTHDKIGMGFT